MNDVSMILYLIATTHIPLISNEINSVKNFKRFRESKILIPLHFSWFIAKSRISHLATRLVSGLKTSENC